MSGIKAKPPRRASDRRFWPGPQPPKRTAPMLRVSIGDRDPVDVTPAHWDYLRGFRLEAHMSAEVAAVLGQYDTGGWHRRRFPLRQLANAERRIGAAGVPDVEAAPHLELAYP